MRRDHETREHQAARRSSDCWQAAGPRTKPKSFDRSPPFGLPVTGTLPAGLNGRYLRNGPNPLGLDDLALQLAVKAA